MKKILYIGHTFHQKTLSSKFFIDILKKNYSVDFFSTVPSSVDNDLKLEINNINKKDYYAIVFWQVIPSIEFLDFLKYKNVILIPMYDNDISMSYSDWEKYIQYKVICFSFSMYQKLEFLGFKNNLYLQYSPTVNIESKKNIHHNNKFNVFFWQRSSDITWSLVKKLLNLEEINSVHMHRVSENEDDDLWFERPSQEDIVDYNITFSSWFDSQEELKECINKCDIFIAPRFYEGIGQAFLEAMTLGKCVIAPNLPTANEYIVDNYNGLLYSQNLIKKLDISNCLLLGDNAKKSMQIIRDKWSSDKENIIPFIDAKVKKVERCINEDLKELSSILDNKYRFISDDIATSNLLNSDFYKTKNKVKSLEYLQFINMLNTKVDAIPLDCDIVVYGAGTGADLILNICSNKIAYIVDKNSERNGTYLNGKVIYHIDKIKNTKNIFIINSLFDRTEVVEKYLINYLSIPKKNIINLDDAF